MQNFEVVIVLPCVITVRAASRDDILGDDAKVSGVRVMGAEAGESLRDAVERLLEVNPRSLNPMVRGIES